MLPWWKDIFYLNKNTGKKPWTNLPNQGSVDGKET